MVLGLKNQGKFISGDIVRKWILAVIETAMLILAFVDTLHAFSGNVGGMKQSEWIRPIAGSCKQVSSCEEAVEMWCGGYQRADGDGDGIPCENVCSSIEEVDQIRQQIGC